MSEPPASSDFTSRSSNSNGSARRSATSASSSSSSSLHRRADPPSDPPDSRHQLSSSVPNVRRNTGSSRGVSTPNARASTGTIRTGSNATNSHPSPTSVKRPTVQPPPKPTTSSTTSRRLDAPETISASVSSVLPTFKGQVSGGSILKIEGKKVMTTGPPVLSDQVKKAMEEARQQHIRENNEAHSGFPTIPSESILTDVVSNRKSTKHQHNPTRRVPLIEQPPSQPNKTNSSKNLNLKTKTYDVDEAKSVTLMDSPSPTSNEEVVKVAPPLNTKTEVAPKIPSDYQKKKPIVNHPAVTTSTSQKKLEETWEFDTAATNTSNSSCCVIS